MQYEARFSLTSSGSVHGHPSCCIDPRRHFLGGFAEPGRGSADARLSLQPFLFGRGSERMVRWLQARAGLAFAGTLVRPISPPAPLGHTSRPACPMTLLGVCRV